MLKKLFYASLLLLSIIITACGSGVATYPPPDKTETFEAALSSDSLPADPTEQAIFPTESSLPDTDAEDTLVPTAIETDDGSSTLETETVEASPEIVTEGSPSDSEIATEQTVEPPAATTTLDETAVPSEIPPTEIEVIPTDAATEIPETAATEPVSTSRAEIATVAPTNTSEPTEVSTNTPEPSATATSTSTNTPEPTATPTSTSTNTPQPSATPTSTSTNTPEPTATPTSTSTNTPEPTATPTSTSTNTPQPSATPTSTSTNTPEPSATPTSTSTNTPEPTTTATSTSTNTPEPSATATSTSTNTPEPSATPTSTSTNTPEPTDTPTSTSTNTPEPTATPTSTSTNTPEPSATPTSTSTNTPQPTDTPTSTSTNTPQPTDTPTSTSTNTPESTTTATSTSTNTPQPTDTPTSTSTNTPDPTATATSTSTHTPEPVELESYENETLGITFDYSPTWSDPIEDDNAIIIIPSEDIEDTSAGNVTILRGTPAEIADEFVVEVAIDTPNSFLESLAADLEDIEINELELEDTDFTALELIGVAEEDSQTIRAIVIDLEDEWIVIIGIAPTEEFETFSTEVIDAILQNLDIDERETSEPIESTQYEGEAVGLEFEYQEDSAIERDGNTLTIQSTIDGTTGNIFIARGTPEDLLEQGHIGDDSNPSTALLSLEPDTDPFVSDQFNPSFQAWTITIETTDDDETYTERLYIVAIRSEWVFIRTSALSQDFAEADENIFAPLLESIIILDEIPE